MPSVCCRSPPLSSSVLSSCAQAQHRYSLTMTSMDIRHDWNSLLDGGSKTPPFQTRSTEYWPSADEVNHYLQDFAQRQVCLFQLPALS